MKLPSILRFKPVYKDNIWGGGKIAAMGAHRDAPTPCGESWEISGHPDGMSIVAEGPLAGLSLAELCTTFGRDLLGSKAPFPDRFPLLFKIIDATDRLSVQVHPSPHDPLADMAEIKNECWFCMEREENAVIFAGFRDDVDTALLEKSVATGEPEIGRLLCRHLPERDQMLYIPSGLVHAIGAGCLIYEVQQSSNTTYRFYDWGRVDSQGRGRQLHIAEAMRSIDWSLPPPEFQNSRSIPGTRLRICLKTDYFTVMTASPVVPLEVPLEMSTGGESFHVVFARNGELDVAAADSSMHILPGGSLLIPASCGAYSVSSTSPFAQVLITKL